ncbi:MAG TPA: nitroreductase family deazaflavin-dependent oxidoreductase [Candidatus Limnocylindria bacterium]|nr:nitroreductase family deazaflavin-dependent oxidoreductase [Candidatus Limnocylindria bacterium]
MAPFERLGHEDFAYLTTTGRRTGKHHTIEIWFALHDGTLYLLSGGGDSADWVRNLRKTRAVRVRIGSRTVDAKAREVKAPDEDALARQLLDEKYMSWQPGKRLSSWARNALPVAIDL